MVDEHASQDPKPPSKRKKHRASRGEPLAYDELKKPTNFTLTPFARQWLKQLAKLEHCSRSELLERWARNQLRVDVDAYRETDGLGR